jgi:hypothetical protein
LIGENKALDIVCSQVGRVFEENNQEDGANRSDIGTYWPPTRPLHALPLSSVLEGHVQVESVDNAPKGRKSSPA